MTNIKTPDEQWNDIKDRLELYLEETRQKSRNERTMWSSIDVTVDFIADLEAKLATATQVLRSVRNALDNAWDGELLISQNLDDIDQALATISGDTKGDDDGK